MMDFIKDSTIGYADIALRVAGYNFKKQHVETVMLVLKKVVESEGEVSLKDIAKITTDMEAKYQIKEESEND